MVRDPGIHRRVLENVVAQANEHQLGLQGLVASPLLGPAGNVEFLAQFVSSQALRNVTEVDAMVDRALLEAAALARGESGA